MSDEIIKVLDDLCKKLGIAAEWTSDNVGPLIERIYAQIVAYSLYKYIFGVFCGILFMIISIGIYAYLNHSPKEKYSKFDRMDTGDANFIKVILCIATILSLAFSLIMGYYVMKTLTFPDIVVFDYVKNFISNNA